MKHQMCLRILVPPSPHQRKHTVHNRHTERDETVQKDWGARGSYVSHNEGARTNVPESPCLFLAYGFVEHRTPVLLVRTQALQLKPMQQNN